MYRRPTTVFAAALVIALASCGGGKDSDPSPLSTIARVKNRPLNNCVSVQAGSRPTRPLTREEQIKQREAEIAAMPPECRPKG